MRTSACAGRPDPGSVEVTNQASRVAASGDAATRQFALSGSRPMPRAPSCRPFRQESGLTGVPRL